MIAKGLRVTELELLTKFEIEKARSCTYRVAIKSEDYEKAPQPYIWPHRVGIRLFKNKRRQSDLLSWDQQSRNHQQRTLQSNGTTPAVNQIRTPQPQTPALINSPVQVQNRFDVPGFASDVDN